MFLRPFRSVKTFITFLVSFVLIFSPQLSYAQAIVLPAPGTMVGPTPVYAPVLMKGLRVHPDNPLLFDFIIDIGDQAKLKSKPDTIEFRAEAQKLMKYFLASLTIPEKDMWVNLSPYEKDRMISDSLGKTEMGRDLLAQDYILKQFSATMMDPDQALGKEFWSRVYAKTRDRFNTTDIPVDAFNKVWIMADQADIFEKNNTAFVTGCHLKVMLESDYLAMQKNAMPAEKAGNVSSAQAVVKDIIHEIMIPEIEKEVNNGKNFAPLRQMFHSLILASWFKEKLKDTFLTQVYADQGKTDGVNVPDGSEESRIYRQYLEAYKKGVVNLIKEELNVVSGETIPRKYFSGGWIPGRAAHPRDAAELPRSVVDGHAFTLVTAGLDKVNTLTDRAMTTREIRLLKSARLKIAKQLKIWLKKKEITEKVYLDALKSTYPSFEEWTMDEDILRIDPNVRAANLQAVIDERWEDIIEAYRKNISFGTAGIRGRAVLSEAELQVLADQGPKGNFLKGPNTINIFKLLKTTAGVIRFAKDSGLKKIVIGYDSRLGGAVFADKIARLFIGASTPEHQFQIFLFDEASPFPELSFGITIPQIKGDIGILISASHNPADFNGYKITLGNGAQLNQVNKEKVLAASRNVKNSEIVLAASLADAKPGQLIWLSGAHPLEDKEYYGFQRIDMHSIHVAQVQKMILNHDIVRENAGNVKIGYAAFNGAGFKAVPRLLREAGFTHVKIISKLNNLDGRFPAWGFGEQPDPGDPISADIAVREFIEEHGQAAFDELDILIGTDPDADRMGLIVKVPLAQQAQFGEYRLLSANDAWTLLLWYRLMMKQKMGNLNNPQNHKVIFSHVTTDAIEAVGRLFDVHATGRMLDVKGVLPSGGYLNDRRTWVGFTYLAEMLEAVTTAGQVVELLAEESNGMSISGHIYEKDGTLAAVLLGEVAAYAKSQGTTLFDMLDGIYAQIGHFATANKALPRVSSFKGASGLADKNIILRKTQEWMVFANHKAATDHPFRIAGRKVIGAIEFKSGRIDKEHYEGVPDEGVRYFFEDPGLPSGASFTDSRNYLTIRPSGTSESLRFYTQVYSEPENITSQQKAKNYHEAERISLEAQKEILESTGLRKYLDPVIKQLKEFFKNAAVEVKTSLTDSAMDKKPDIQGGIDFNAQGLRMNVTQDAQGGVNITYDPAMIEEFKRGDFTGFTPVIINVVPLTNIFPLLGLGNTEENEAVRT